MHISLHVLKSKGTPQTRAMVPADRPIVQSRGKQITLVLNYSGDAI